MTQNLPDWVWEARSKWLYRGQIRPLFAQEPHKGQESVWDYPRPPAGVSDFRRVVVCSHGKILADSLSTFRILETASPPTFYFPPGDVEVSRLVLAGGSSICEWKGIAHYWARREAPADKVHEPVAWVYTHPFPGFEIIAGYFAFYPGRVECYVNEERVMPQAGGLYGGWVTREIVGPFKGLPETAQW
jgi:uncharacterized protein (DUF427 family)